MYYSYDQVAGSMSQHSSAIFLTERNIISLLFMFGPKFRLMIWVKSAIKISDLFKYICIAAGVGSW